MKKILYIIPILLLAASCAKEPFEQGQKDGQAPVKISIATKAGDDGKTPVNSVRVLAFNTNSLGNNVCILNEFFPFGFETELKKDTTTPNNDSTIVTINKLMWLNISDDKSYDIFVVLNEEGYKLSNGNSLQSDLSTVDDSYSMSDFISNIIGKPALYDKAVKEEPYILMSGHQEVTITNADEPTHVHFNTGTSPASDIKRSMAMITVDEISSRSLVGLDSLYLVNLPKLFVLDARIVNVPKAMAWNYDTLGHLLSATDTIQIPLGKANGAGYYDREWSGSVYKDVDVNVTRKEETSARYYRSTWAWKNAQHQNDDDNMDKYGWTFDTTSTAHVIFRDGTAANDNHKKTVYKSAVTHMTNIDKLYNEGNNKSVDSLVVRLGRLFSAPDTSDFWENDVRTINEVVGYPTSPATYYEYCSREPWSINLGESFYVPENISSTVAGATCIQVTLGLADPKINLTGVAATALPAPGTITGTGTSAYFLDNTYYDKAGVFHTQSVDLSTETFDKNFKLYKTVIKNGSYDDPGNIEIKNGVIPALFGIHGHIVNADDEMIEYASNLPDNQIPTVNNFRVYVDGFYRKTTGLTGTTTVNNKFGTFSWNVPAINAASGVRTFTIPVNNNIDEADTPDYSVYRNTKYTITLHVGPATLNAFGITKVASLDDGMAIYATVKTEKLNEYED